MKIAQIVCSYPPYYGGMGNVVFQSARELTRRGHEVEVFTPSYYEEKEIRPEEAPPDMTHEPALQNQIEQVRRIAPEFQYGNAARMGKIQHELDAFDLVHLHYPFFGTAGIISKWKKNHPSTPLVITYHMDTRAPDWRGLIFKLYAKFWMPRILHSADALIASSYDFIAESDARLLYTENKSKWFEIPFGVDSDIFQPRQKPLELFRQFNLDPAKETLLFVGGLDKAHYFKGVPVLLDAILKLQYGYKKDFQIIIAGDGELRPQFEDRARIARLSGVRFIGHVDDEMLPPVYNMADLFVLPSINRGEAFGLVLLEAMASGVPVIATDLPGVRSVADSGGLVVPPNDSEELARAIAGYFDLSAEDRADWQTHAREVVEEKFSWIKVTDQLEELYVKLVK